MTAILPKRLGVKEEIGMEERYTWFLFLTDTNVKDDYFL